MFKWLRRKKPPVTRKVRLMALQHLVLNVVAYTYVSEGVKGRQLLVPATDIGTARRAMLILAQKDRADGRMTENILTSLVWKQTSVGDFMQLVVAENNYEYWTDFMAAFVQLVDAVESDIPTALTTLILSTIDRSLESLEDGLTL